MDQVNITLRLSMLASHAAKRAFLYPVEGPTIIIFSLTGLQMRLCLEDSLIRQHHLEERIMQRIDRPSGPIRRETPALPGVPLLWR